MNANFPVILDEKTFNELNDISNREETLQELAKFSGVDKASFLRFMNENNLNNNQDCNVLLEAIERREMAGAEKRRRQYRDIQMKFVLRMPESLQKKIKRAAKKNNTSMNTEITNILNDSFKEQSTDSVLQDLVRRLEKKKVI